MLVLFLFSELKKWVQSVNAGKEGMGSRVPKGFFNVDPVVNSRVNFTIQQFSPYFWWGLNAGIS